MAAKRRRRGWGPGPLVVSGIVLILSLGAIGILVRLAGTSSVAVHLFYLPIIYGAFVFGDLGAIFTGLAAALICGVWMPAGVNQGGTEPQVLSDILIRAAVFYVVAIVCSRAFTELRRRANEQRTLYEVAASITSSLRLREVLDLIAQFALEVMSAKGCGIRLLDPGTDELQLVATAGLDDDYWEKGPVKASETADQPTLRGEVEEIFNAPTDPLFKYKDAAKRAGVSSVLTVPLQTKAEVIGRIRIYSRRRRHFRQRDIDLLTAFADQASVAIENARLYEDIRRNYYETVRALTRAIEAKDLDTFSHSERVTEVVEQMAEEMRMAPDQRELLRFGAILHDVGKIGVAEQSMEARNPADQEAIFYQMHPLIGQSILKPIGFLQPALPAVLYHHERWDGEGFPEGRKGRDIPETARMTAIGDAYDRLRHPSNNGGPGMSVREALEQIATDAGSRFDPDLVRILRRVILAHTGAPAEAEDAPAGAQDAPPAEGAET